MNREKLIDFDGVKALVKPVNEAVGECIGEIKTGKRRKGHETAGKLNGVAYEKPYSYSRFWWRAVGVIVSEDAAGKDADKHKEDFDPMYTHYVRVMKRNIFPFIAFIIALCAAAEFTFFVVAGQNAAKNTFNAAKNTFDYIGNAIGITKPNKNVKADVSKYSSFESMPDQIWKAGERKQTMIIRNLAGNSIDICPHVYVDLNGDGKFTSSECLWNPAIYNKNGNVKDAGMRIAPGKEIKEITLNKVLKPGTYAGEVVYSAYDEGTDEKQNGMNFNFKVKVK